MRQKNVNRRDFLRLSTFAVGGAALAACGTAAPETSGGTGTQASVSAAAPAGGSTAAASLPAATTAASAAAAVAVQQGEVAFWSEFAGAASKAVMDSIVAAFNAEHPDITVKHVTFATNNDYEAAVKAAFASGEVPDVVELNAGGWLSPYVEAQQLTDLTDLVSQHTANFDPGTIGVVTYRGKQWAAPFGKVPGNLIYYNRDILAEQGIDGEQLTTWSAFTAACEQLKQASITPITVGNKEGWPGSHWLTHLFVRSMGVEKSVELMRRGLEPGFQSSLKFTDPAAVRPWELLKELQDNGYFSAGILTDDFPTAYGKFFNGDSAFFQTGGWLLSTQLKEAPDFNMGYMLLPALDGVAESNASDFVFNCLALTVPIGAKEPDKARTFVEWWLTSETPHRMWSEQRPGELPAMTTITEIEGVPQQANDFLAFQTNAAQSTMFLDSLVNGDLGVELTWEATNGLFSGALTPQQAAENAERLVSEWQANNPS